MYCWYNITIDKWWISVLLCVGWTINTIRRQFRFSEFILIKRFVEIMEKISHLKMREHIKIQNSHILKLIIVIILLMTCTAQLNADDGEDELILDNASLLLRQNNPQSAYQLLEKYEDEYSGWWEYDYLLGVAALESGHANLAIFALQRSLAMNPNLVGARVDLGRAYFEVNEFVPAKAEFEAVIKYQPIEKIDDMARNYLRRIEQRTNPRRFMSRYYLETAGGYDSNANSATDDKTFNGFVLPDENIKTSSTFLSLKVGTMLFMKLNSKNSFRFDANLSQRQNQNISSVNYVNSNGLASWNYRYQYTEQVIGVRFSKTNVSNNFQLYSTSLNFSLNFRLLADAHFSLNSSFTNFTYSKSLSLRNSNQAMFGATLIKYSKKISVPTLNFSLFAGENIPRGELKINGKNMFGGRAGLQYQIKRRLPVHLGFSSGILYSSYKEQQLSKDRNDILMDFSLIATIRPWKSWETALKTAIVNNNSDIGLYQYTRVSTALSVKKIF